MSREDRLFISDLDGTLLNERGCLSVRTRRGLLQLLEQGIQFTVASARSHFTIASIFGNLPLNLPIIEFNGAFVTDYKTGEHLETNSLDTELAEEVFDKIMAAKLRPFVSSFNGRENCLHYDELINSGMLWYENRRRRAKDTRLRRTPKLRETMKEEVVSLTVMSPSEGRIHELRGLLASEYGERLRLYIYENEYSKGTWWLTIHEERASKHIAMQTLRDQFLPGASITAVGDNFNDVEMLKAADVSVAVENAVPELLKLAQKVVGHHTRDSVVRFLEEEYASCLLERHGDAVEKLE